MSTALSHLGFTGISMLSGDSSNYSYADLLEEQFGPANAPGVDGLDELFDELEAWLEEDDDNPAPGLATS